MRERLQKLRRKLHKSNEGAALLTVLVALMIISIVVLEFQFSSIIEQRLAYNDLNQLRAYYLAKSGTRVSLLRIAMYSRAKADPNVKKMAGKVDVSPYLETIWKLPLPAFPPDTSKLGKMLKSDKDAAEKTLQQTKVAEGQFTSSITSEGSKINLNFLVLPTSQVGQPIDFNPPATHLYQQVGLMLVTLLDNMIRESDDPYEEFGDLRPEELVYNIIDWINPGSVSVMGGSKDAYYETQNPPYKAKRNRFYTLDELKLVKGINERIFNRLKPYVTVYSYDGKLNLNSIGEQVLRSLHRDFTEDDVKKINEERARIGQWSSEDEFFTFVTETLGRSSFKQQYPDKTKYPFTVSSQSFMIESLGLIKRSKSQIQRVIDVGVAMTYGKKDVSKLPPADCAKDQALFLDPRFNPPTCRYKPTSGDECVAIAGSWSESEKCCRLPSVSNPVCTNAGGAGGGGSGTGSPSTGTQVQQTPPNGLKILYWTET